MTDWEEAEPLSAAVAVCFHKLRYCTSAFTCLTILLLSVLKAQVHFVVLSEMKCTV